MVPFRSHLADGVNAEGSRPKAQGSRSGKCRPPGGSWCFLFTWAWVIGHWAFQPTSAFGAEAGAGLAGWLAAQTNLQTWSADVTQTRALKTLTQPLVAAGRVWFAAPNHFRWELTSPSPTIAVRQPEQMLVIYPRLKRAERYPLNGEQAGPWKDTLSLLEAGFPRSQAELESRFNVMSQTVSNAALEVVLQPKSPSARRLMPQIKITIATNGFTPRATELHFADGSTMRNDFGNAKLNPKLEDDLFTPKVGGDYKLVEPARGHK
jgi:outer membrane lipoprotein-sorting protein